MFPQPGESCVNTSYRHDCSVSPRVTKGLPRHISSSASIAAANFSSVLRSGGPSSGWHAPQVWNGPATKVSSVMAPPVSDVSAPQIGY